MGPLHTLEDIKKKYGVDETYYASDIKEVLKDKGASLLLTLVSLLLNIVCQKTGWITLFDKGDTFMKSKKFLESFGSRQELKLRFYRELIKIKC